MPCGRLLWVWHLDFDTYSISQKPPINAHVDIFRRARGLNFGLSLHLHPYFVYAVSEDCGEGADSPKHWLLNIAKGESFQDYS